MNRPSPRWNAIAPIALILFFLFLTFSAEAQLAYSPAGLNFGNVAVGSRSTLTGVFVNQGTSSVTIRSVSVNGTGFTISGMALPMTLSPGQSANYSVSFSPQSAGAAVGTCFFNVKTSMSKRSRFATGSSLSTSVPLSGTGTVLSGQLAVNPTSVSFGTVALGGSASQSQSVTNNGSASVTISAAAVSSSAFKVSGVSLPATLAAGQSLTFSLTFMPATSGTTSGNLTLTSNASNPTLSVPLSGTGQVLSGQLAANPTSVSFGTVALGGSASQYQSLTNSGNASVTISQAAVSSSAFNLSGVTLPMTLAAGQSATFSMTFTPAVSGTTSGNLTLTSNASNPTLSVALSGSASAPGQLSVSPGSIDFGSVIVGQSTTKTGSVTASGSSVTISSVSPSTAEFSVSGIALPKTLSAGQSASYNVTFTPQLSGATIASLQIASNAANPVVAEALSGSGAAAPSHSVDLSWNASTSTVAGYNVYRGTMATGPFTKLNSTLDAGTTFTDNNVQSGTTYYYVATSVDDTGAESGYSTAVPASVPTP